MSNKLSYFKRFTRGGQVLSHDISMFRQILVKLINLKALFLLFGLSLVCTYQISTPKELHYAWELGLAKIANQLNKKEYTVFAYKGQKAINPIRSVLEEPWLNYEYNIIKRNFILSFLGVFLGYILFLVLIQWFLQRRGKDQARERHLRGAKLGDHQEIKKELKKRKAVSKIKLGGVPIVAGYENRHFFLHGTTGSGKTQCISQLLDYARENNQRAIILDEKGGLIEKFYDPARDVILNPLDSRSVTW